jgi:hypothetical protein
MVIILSHNIGIEIVKGLEEVKRKIEDLELQNSRLRMSANANTSGISVTNPIIDGSLEQLSKIYCHINQMHF